jgi:hypothetical protein
MVSFKAERSLSSSRISDNSVDNRTLEDRSLNAISRNSFSSFISSVFNPEVRAALQEERRAYKDARADNSRDFRSAKNEHIENLQKDGCLIETRKLSTHLRTLSNPSNVLSGMEIAKPGIAQILSPEQLKHNDYIIIKGHRNPEIDGAIRSPSGLGGLTTAGVAMVFEPHRVSLDMRAISIKNLGGKSSYAEILETFAHNELTHANLMNDAKFMAYMGNNATNQETINKAVFNTSGGALRRPIETFEFLSDAASISYNRGDIARILGNALLNAKGLQGPTAELSEGYLGSNRLMQQALQAYSEKSGRPEIKTE